MTELSKQKCAPCEGGVQPYTRDEANQQMKLLNSAWNLAPDAKSLHRAFAFKNFYRTMSFVNAVAHIANTEDHHPDLEVGYNYCRMKFSTHSIGGLSRNDFICAAKIDELALE
jgi:4a-hydroxytetrahydrobiopterin dehydratase